MDIVVVFGIRGAASRLQLRVDCFTQQDIARKLVDAIVMPDCDLAFENVKSGYNPAMSVRRNLLAAAKDQDVGSDPNAAARRIAAPTNRIARSKHDPAVD